MKAALILTTLVAGGVGIYSLSDCESCCPSGPEVCEVSAPFDWSDASTVADTQRSRVTAQIAGQPEVFAATPVRADFVEARSASVFAGACHVGSEAASQGRQALMAWAIREGAAVDADLAGVRVVAAVSGDRNLAEGGERASVVWIDAPRGARQLSAAKAWLAGEHGAILGDVRRVEPHSIAFDLDGGQFAVAVGDVVALRGEAIADGSCCSMQEHRWYEPLGAAAGQPVGVPDECSFAGVAGLPAWRYEGANNTFVGEYVGAAAAGVRGGSSARTCEDKKSSCGVEREVERCSTEVKSACGTTKSTVDA